MPRFPIIFVLRVLLKLLLLPVVLTAKAGSVSYSHSIDSDRFDQRQNYLDAIHLIRTSQFTRLQKVKPHLRSYTLYPYLEYTEIIYRISRQSTKDILAFAQRYHDTPLVEPLVQHWLKNLAKRGQWKTFLTHYENMVNSGPVDSTKDLACHYGFALHKNALRKQAFNQAKKLWLVGFSQPKACDPIFQIWRAANGISRELAWERLGLSLKENKSKLSKYLLRYIHKKDKVHANNYRLVHLKPRTIKRYKSFRQDNQRNREIILHGVVRLARTDPEAAIETLQRYESTHSFEPEALEDSYASIGIRLAGRSTDLTLTDKLPVNLRNHPKLIEARIRQSLKQNKFSTVLVLISLLPDQMKGSPRWLYWKARVLYRSADFTDRKSAEEIFQALASERSFYGFLAADLMNMSYSFQHEPALITREQILSLEEMPGMQRALELFALGERSRARREWYFTIADFTIDQLQIAANVALRWGWYKTAIQSMIQAGTWNHLEYRFPIAYQDNFMNHARRANIPLAWSLAVARQESAFMPDARSSAGALGVMQLMPATAKLVANRIGAKYRYNSELTQTDLNIRLGTHYLAQMLRRYKNNRVLASTAYNAGPGRVDKWLNPSLPFDIWIETIPFSETRGYVQNVLLFSAIYAQQMDETQPMIYEHERAFFSDPEVIQIITINPDNS